MDRVVVAPGTQWPWGTPSKWPLFSRHLRQVHEGNGFVSLSAKLISYALLPDMELQKDMEVNLEIQLTSTNLQFTGGFLLDVQYHKMYLQEIEG